MVACQEGPFADSFRCSTEFLYWFRHDFKSLGYTGPYILRLWSYGSQNHHIGDGLLGPNLIMVVYVDPLGSVHAFNKNSHFNSELSQEPCWYKWCLHIKNSMRGFESSWALSSQP